MTPKQQAYMQRLIANTLRDVQESSAASVASRYLPWADAKTQAHFSDLTPSDREAIGHAIREQLTQLLATWQTMAAEGRMPQRVASVVIDQLTGRRIAPYGLLVIEPKPAQLEVQS